jgi:hypothetical protein
MRDLFEQVVDLSNQAAQLNREYICVQCHSSECRESSRDGSAVNSLGGNSSSVRLLYTFASQIA